MPGVGGRLLALLAILIAAGALAMPSRASAHAILEVASPEQYSRVPTVPPRVSLRFSEQITLVRPADDLTVVDSRGASVVAGKPRRLPQDKRVLEAGLRQDLRTGTYTVRYRVLSADSHVVVGAYTFAIGDGPIGRPVLTGAGSGPAEDGGWAVSARVLELIGIGGLFGLVAFRWLVWRSAWNDSSGMRREEAGEAVAWMREVFWLSFAVLALGSLVAEAYLLLVKSASLLGTSVFGAIGDPSSVIQTLEDNKFGSQLQLRAALLVVLFATGLVQSAIENQAGEKDPLDHPAGRPVAAALMAVVSLVLIGSISVQGHASQAKAPTLSILADTIHVAGSAVWIAGLVLTLGAMHGLPVVAPTGGPLLAARVLARFSQVALVAVTVVILTGTARTFGELSDPAQLWDTAHGRSILIKLALLVPVGFLALRNRKIVNSLHTVRTPSNATLALVRRSVSVEIALSFAIIVVAALLVGQVPGGA